MLSANTFPNVECRMSGQGGALCVEYALSLEVPPHPTKVESFHKNRLCPGTSTPPMCKFLGAESGRIFYRELNLRPSQWPGKPVAARWHLR